MEKKRILFVVSTLNTGGAQRVLANISLGFPDTWECDFLLNDSSEITYPYRGNVITLGMMPKEDKTSVIYQVQVFIRRYQKLRKLKRIGHYDACISALTSANAVNVLTGNKYCKTITSIHIFMTKGIERSKYLERNIKSMAVKTLSNMADHTVAVSESIRRDLIQHFKVREDKVVTIYNGYPQKQIQMQAQEMLLSEEEKWFEKGKRYIVTVGRLDEQKGQFHLLRAFRKIKENIPDAGLLILGEGELEDALRRLAVDLNLQESIVFCGFVQNPHKIMARCDVFALPSIFEGFPNTLAESLCMGLPAVSADCDSGAREMLAPDTDVTEKVQGKFELAQYGILCPVCDGKLRTASEPLTTEEEIMADAIIYLMQNEDVYSKYKEESVKRGAELDIKGVMQQWVDLVENDKI